MENSKRPITKKSNIIQALKTVLDPELGVDLYTLGLIYDIRIQRNGGVRIQMTYTTPFCPYGPQLKDRVRSALTSMGIENIEIKLVFDPPWEPRPEIRELING